MLVALDIVNRPVDRRHGTWKAFKQKKQAVGCRLDTTVLLCTSSTCNIYVRTHRFAFILVFVSKYGESAAIKTLSKLVAMSSTEFKIVNRFQHKFL
jgi:hypothetical protein